MGETIRGTSSFELDEILDFLRPKAHPFTLVRVGGRKDGAYLLPNKLSEVTACFSPGVRNRKTFEDELWNSFNIRSHMADFSSEVEAFETPLMEPVQTFEKLWISRSSSSDSISLNDWVRAREPGDEANLMLQMDIEGGEFDVLPFVADNLYRRFRIIVLELHKLRRLAIPEELVSRFLPTFEALMRNYAVIHAHPNNCCGWSVNLGSRRIRVPSTLEITMVSKDWLEDERSTGKRFHIPFVPHPLDIFANDPLKKPAHLVYPWTGFSAMCVTWVVIARNWVRFLLLWSWRKHVPSKFLKWVKESKPSL